jgi:hypothetical protein
VNGGGGVRARTAADRFALKDRATDRGSHGGGGESVERGRLAERGRDGPPAGPQLGLVYVQFTSDGPVTVGAVDSPVYEPHEDLLLIGARARLTTAGGSGTTVDVKVNGDSIGSITWASGADLAVATFEDLLEADTDLLTVRCTEAGTDAVGISIRFEFDPR